MATRISRTLTYEAPLEEVRAMLLDQSFREQVCEQQQCLRWTVSPPAVEGDATVVRIERVHSMEGVPSVARKLVGDEITIDVVETWADTAADVSWTIPGRPGTITGTIRLAESGGTTTEDVELEIRVGVPLVGGRIETMVGGLVDAALDVEQDLGRRHLAR